MDQPPPPPALQRYKLTVAYDGTLFHGWQKQEPPGRPAFRTVAGELEAALMRTLQQPVRLVGSSRTDAGVHALGQVAHFDAVTRIPLARLADAINSRLPADVEVRGAEPVPQTFDAISATKSKQYRYRVFNSSHRPLDKRNYVWHCWWKLDTARMQDAARRLVGEHNFAGFAAADHGRTSTTRTIFDCQVLRDPAHEPEVHVVVSGSGFLYNMVRIIAGTLVEVGRGHFEPDVVERVLASGDRRLAGLTLPPQGLWLEWVRYEP